MSSGLEVYRRLQIWIWMMSNLSDRIKVINIYEQIFLVQILEGSKNALIGGIGLDTQTYNDFSP